MRKLFIYFIILFFGIITRSNASHIVGGDITVKWLNGNEFEVTLRFYRDCLNGQTGTEFPSTITLGMYDKITNLEQQTFSLNLVLDDTLKLGDSCYTPPNLCVEQGNYTGTITIPDNPNGYYLSWQKCCRNGIIDNILDPGNTAITYYVEIPDPALHNSTPVFGNYPNAYMCRDYLNVQNFSCIDADGDSLVYSLITPLNDNVGSTDPNPPPSPGPYPLIGWKPPYDATNMVGGTPSMSINAQTGILTAKPNNFGVFVFAVRVEEYKNGVKLGEIRRDIQYQVLACNFNDPPQFDDPLVSTITSIADTTYEILAGDSMCVDISLSDPNLIDKLTIKATTGSELLSGAEGVPITFFKADSSFGKVGSKICVHTTCDNIRETPYRVTFYGQDFSCYGTDTVWLKMGFRIISPFDGSIRKPVPNVFTPNDDGKNDYYQVNASVNYCFDTFEIEIYNRWGLLVLKSNDFLFQWDGKNQKGKELPGGVYYYILKANFRDSNFQDNGFIQLMR